MLDLYGTFTLLDTVHVKGAMTVGENTDDIGGVAIAYDALKLTKHGADTAKLGGFTPFQRFFTLVALIWRVNSPLMNNPHFYTAFDVKPGDSLYLAEEKRIHIW